MSNGWGGADPVQVIDAGSYELGTEYVANQQITISAVRVWAGASPVDLPGRTGRIWTTAGFQLGSATMATTLPSGWSTYNLASPVTINAAQHFVVSFGTGGNYGAGSHYLDSDVTSGDGALTAVAAASSVHGNGIFNTSVGSFPASTNVAHFFYGADVVYTLGSGSDQPPVITGFTVTAVEALATATLNATDPDSDLSGAQYSFDWGDGHRSLNLPSGSATHTYATSGDYAVLGWVTDAGGQATYGAASVEIDISPSVSSVDSNALLNAVMSHAISTGFFDRFNGHEPASPPGNGLTGSLWVDTGPDPVASRSGLATVNVKTVLNVRLYMNMKPTAEPEERDQIDPEMIRAVDALMSAYAGAFTLDGLIEEIDLLGMVGGGTPLGVRYGYITIGSTLYRAATITVPCILGDAWREIP